MTAGDSAEFYEQALEVALEASSEAATLLLEGFGEPLELAEKSNKRDIVSNFDVASQESMWKHTGW